MAWPTSDDLKRRLNLEPTGAHDDDMDRYIGAGIAWVKTQVGDWDEGLDAPGDALSQSALERAIELATNGQEAEVRKSGSLLYGHRRRFGIA